MYQILLYRDCRTYENLVKHICVAPPNQPVKRVKRTVDLTNGSNEISELLQELEGVTKKGGTIKSGIYIASFFIPYFPQFYGIDF